MAADDLTAARERHVKGAMPALCHHDPLNYPCDAARFRDALDAERIHHADPFSVWQGTCGHLWRKVDSEDCPTCAARADADELAAALRSIKAAAIQHSEMLHPDPEHPGIGVSMVARAVVTTRIDAALAKWEASRDDAR